MYLCLCACVCFLCACVCFLFLFNTSFSLTGNSGGLTWVRLHQPPEQRYPFLSVCAVFPCVQTMVYGCQWLGFLTSAQMLMHVTAHRGCTDTVTESALEADSGRKIPCRTGDSNPRQYCAWLFTRTLYQLSYSRPSLPLMCLHLALVW